ncbi:hypothetical protein SAMN05421788_101103 [Filimonas lacunae]|uniref:Uncharacterized protein n=1 Tax=Filimonas lacunae TaxID=477680 RepID=A0A173MLY9_9BACT|nr:hypothetical protein [Filimonas lacunae]BAV08644.1 hypothetical protein FLA_4691 [Filimonas lacunae]SIS59096.1 hypothetical protein SAMN05421788_101103 [Filimonas lacunae]
MKIVIYVIMLASIFLIKQAGDRLHVYEHGEHVLATISHLSGQQESGSYASFEYRGKVYNKKVAGIFGTSHNVGEQVDVIIEEGKSVVLFPEEKPVRDFWLSVLFSGGLLLLSVRVSGKKPLRRKMDASEESKKNTEALMGQPLPQTTNEKLDHNYLLGAIRFEGSYSFYLMPIAYWILNYGKYDRSFEVRNQEFVFRGNVYNVDDRQIVSFLSAIGEDKINNEEARKLIEDGVRMVFFVDFDSYLFIDGFKEIFLDDYMPNEKWQVKMDDPIKFMPKDLPG